MPAKSSEFRKSNRQRAKDPTLPPGQQLVGNDKWPIVGEREPAQSDLPHVLEIHGLVANPLTYTLEDLTAFPQIHSRIDIHCVTRWSKLGVEFSGVLLADLLIAAVVDAAAKFVSFVSRSQRHHSSSMSLKDALSLETLIALKSNGKPLPENHGGPIRNIVPGRYFYKSVKWLERIEFLAEDRLGFWESESGYHNNADPWKEQRYLAPAIDRRIAFKLIESRNFRDHDLRSIDASKRDLAGLIAINAILRNANFRDAILEGADFSGANLSNAHFENADLKNANFTGADLEGANLSGADLRRANLSGCSLIGASFCDFDDLGKAIHGAKFDNSTTLPVDLLQPLVSGQFKFVTAQLSQSRGDDARQPETLEE